MKKKKLKKRLKKLERRLSSLKGCHNVLALKVSDFKNIRENMEETINDLNDLMADIKNQPKDNRINILWEWMQRSGIDFHDWGKTPTYAEEVVYTEDIQRQINEINDRLNVLDNRTRTDYTTFTEAPKNGN